MGNSRRPSSRPASLNRKFLRSFHNRRAEKARLFLWNIIMTAEESRPGKEPWHLDKRVNISVIAGLVLQAIIFGVAWGNVENRVTQLEADRARFNTIPERLAGIEATLLAIKERLDRSERQ
jgi:hypothetical protein